MSTKRTAAESSSNEDSVFQQEDNAKCAKLASLSETMLQDLPMELLEYILVQAVVLKVKDMKLAKSVWKEKADLVISKLGAVCVRWNNILTTKVFRNTVHRIIDGTAQGTFRLEVLHESPMPSSVFRVAAIRDEMFILWKPENQERFINVHDRNMMKRKHVVPLPGINPKDMVACSVSNCLYVLNKNSSGHRSVLRITNDDERRFNISPWVNNDLCLPFNCLFVAINGNLIILSHQNTPNPSVVSIYNANGCLQHAITLFPAIHGFRFISGVLQKSNGNLVLCTVNDSLHIDLKEVDMMGSIKRQYHSSIGGDGSLIVADDCGRIMVASRGNNGDLLDSELNLLDLTVPQHNKYFHLQGPYGMQYNSERNEIVRFYIDGLAHPTKVLTIFRFTGE